LNEDIKITNYSRPEIAPETPYRVLVPLSNVEEARTLLPLAETLVQEQQGQLIILNTLSVPEEESLSSSASKAIRFRETLANILNELTGITSQIQTLVRYQNEIWSGIWETVLKEGVALLLLGWETDQLLSTAVNDLADSRLAAPPCDVVAILPGPLLSDSLRWSSIKNILLPVKGSYHSTLTLRVGHALAQRMGASMTLLHVTPPDEPDSEDLFLDEFSPAIQGLSRITRSVTIRGSISQAIIEEAKSHQLLVMGAPSSPSKDNLLSGPLIHNVIAGMDRDLIIVKEREKTAVFPSDREEPVSVSIDRPVAVVVDKWFAENTFHSREFSNLERLLALKEQQDVTISLGLPALNEERTVGEVIRTIKTNLMDEFPLLDEMILIDSGSTDNTRQIAAELGVPVYIHQEILPQHGSFRGKGEALWKSLYVLTGDIVAWIDTDISNIHPRFVYGILGPLLRDANIQYVKGFYRRPLREGNKMVAGGGGRVTELTARPFFNMFFPELSGLIQPLSGEYAGRRSALERMPFFTGYGVETGLLIDILSSYGLQALAQVDLLERIHHNQPLPSLSKMSFAIMQVVLKRVEKRRQTRLIEKSNLTMNLIRYGQRRRYYLEPEEIREHERPPMTTIPEYTAISSLPENDEKPPGNDGHDRSQEQAK
jgi:glycosyltransferase involved in cell wall biosynthesis/nucleotide-binding universal stress UspA family protein